MSEPQDSPIPHLIIPYASASAEAAQALLPHLALPNLQQLLSCLTPQGVVQGHDHTYSPPHETAWAEALGWAWPDGQHPWAGWLAQHHDTACAWVHLCHWQVGMDQVILHPLAASELSDTESQALRQALAPLWAEDGLQLHQESPERWRVEGPALQGLRCASLDRVAHRAVADWPNQGPASPLLMRLQNEAQMLFYQHPVNDERAARGQTVVNALWFSAAGTATRPTAPSAAPTLPDTLRQAALRGDWPQWQQAWQALDAELLPTWLARAQQQHPLTLTLCGERHHQHWHLVPRHQRSWWQRLTQGWANKPSLPHVLGHL